MTARKKIPFLAVGLAVIGWGSFVVADDDVTVISTSTNAPAKSQQQTADSDGSPVVHKSSHKKKPTATASDDTGNSNSAAASATTTMTSTQQKPAKTGDVVVGPAPHAPITVNRPLINVSLPSAPPTIIRLPAGSAPPTMTTPSVTVGSPTVNTGLPVPRYTGIAVPIVGVSTYSPPPNILPSIPPTHVPYFASSVSSPTAILPSTSASPPVQDDFVFNNLHRRHKNVYPWKTEIITTMFWIGEGSTPISSTTNLASSWDEDWRANNHGSDSPNNRNGYASGAHASTLNPFYVALPFNDLAFPDKAARWLPAGWYRRPRDGKQVSACKDHWVEIKNSRGDICFAQWEDVGPLRYDQAEYVFGSERPIGLGDNHAGLDVSPAVAEYLNIEGKDRAYTSWRFVDEEDVRPGAWLKYDEQAVLYTALHQLKGGAVPIDKTSEPIEDQNDADANKKKIDASKG